MTNELEQSVLSKAQKWLDGEYDEATKEQVRLMMNNDRNELIESFYKDLEFGTGGLRGIMGAGTNRMNIYTVGAATQGLANYLKKNFEGEAVRVAISHDSRNNSRMFAERVADIFASNGFTVYLFDALRPTPELSFAIRELKCQSGVMVTASHNPKEYNGYKAYWTDGSQVTSPHDVNIIAEVEKITENSQVLTGRNPENIHILDESFDEKYLDAIHELSLSPESIARHRDMKIVYTPLHGAGVRLVPASLRKWGFENIISVPEQTVLDGNFPTVESPNPEERKTMAMAIELARKEGADLAMATDPDSDRIGLALRNGKGEYVLLNGNQTLVLLMCYQLTRWAELGKIDGNQYVVKTIVTSTMPDAVAEHFGVKCYNCLTGFKFIAKIIRENEGKAKYIGGGEESFGYLPGDFVRDKDGVASCSLAAEAAAWAKDTMGLTLYEWLQELYVKYGFYREGLVNVVRKGKDTADDGRLSPEPAPHDPLVARGQDLRLQDVGGFGCRYGRQVAYRGRYRQEQRIAVAYRGRHESIGASVGYRAQDQVLLRRQGAACVGGRFRARRGRAGCQDRGHQARARPYLILCVPAPPVGDK